MPIFQMNFYFSSDVIKYVVCPFGIVIYVAILRYIQYRSTKRGIPKLVIPNFEVPENLSPTAVRYLFSLKYDVRSLVASLLNLYIRNYITITITDHQCIIRRTSSTKIPQLEEDRFILEVLFRANKQKIILDKKEDITNLKHSAKQLEKRIRKQLEKKKYFVPNLVVIFFIALASLFVYFISAILILPSNVLPFSILLGSCTILVFIFCWSIYIGSRIGRILFSILLFIFVAFTNAAMDFELPYFALILPLWFLFVSITWFFSKKMKLLTKKGIDTKIKLLGLHSYLKTAEAHRYDALNKKSNTLNTKEELLPYAIALDIPNDFGNKLESLLKKMV